MTDPRIQRLCDLAEAARVATESSPLPEGVEGGREAVAALSMHMSDLLEQFDGALAYSAYAASPQSRAEERARLQEEA